MKRKAIFLVAATALLSSCGGGDSKPVTTGSDPAASEPATVEASSEATVEASSEATVEESSEEKPNEISVFVLAGQSNMEGQTQWIGSNNQTYLKDAMTALDDDERYDVDPADYDSLVEGLPQVKVNFYGYPYGEPYDLHASYPRGELSDDNYLVEGLKGKFEPARAGMGFKRKNEAKERWMGPELGCAYALSKKATAENPVYFVKCAFSGSGFEKNAPDPTWKPEITGDQYSLYTDKLKPMLNNSIETLKTENPSKKIVIKGFIWHQGESDSGSANISKYYDNMTHLLDTFRTDYAAYAPEANGANIAFLDCTIFDGTGAKGGMTWSDADKQAAEKAKIAALSDKNFLINGSVVDEDGLGFNIQGDGGDGMAHYCTKDSFRLGLEYGKIILDNNLI